MTRGWDAVTATDGEKGKDSVFSMKESLARDALGKVVVVDYESKRKSFYKQKGKKSKCCA